MGHGSDDDDAYLDTAIRPFQLFSNHLILNVGDVWMAEF